MSRAAHRRPERPRVTGGQLLPDRPLPGGGNARGGRTADAASSPRGSGAGRPGDPPGRPKEDRSGAGGGTVPSVADAADHDPVPVAYRKAGAAANAAPGAK